MNKEKFKTLILISLVCISVFLTEQLWMQIPHEIPTFFGANEDKRQEYLISDMIVPYKYLINFNENNHTLLYSDQEYGLWASTKDLLIDMFYSKDCKIKEISDETFLEYQKYKSINFYLPEAISPYLLAKVLNTKDSGDISKSVSNIDGIYIYLEKKAPFVVLSNDCKHFKVENINIETKGLRQIVTLIENKGDYTHYYSMKDTLESQNDIYIPYEMNNNLSIVYIENEIDIDKAMEIEDIAENFFQKDIDYIKEIVEDDGSLIYIYDQRVLKVYPNGLLEFFSPIEEPVKKRNLYICLNTVADFMSTHFGASKGMYLSEIKEIESDGNLGYSLTFNYRIRGIPVILGSNDIKGYIQVEVFNKYVKSYRRYMRKDMEVVEIKDIEDRKMLSAFDVIDKNFNHILSMYKKDLNIKVEDDDLNEELEASMKDITLAYYDPCVKSKEEKLIGVWVVVVGNRMYAFDVYTGEIVYENIFNLRKL